MVFTELVMCYWASGQFRHDSQLHPKHWGYLSKYLLWDQTGVVGDARIHHDANTFKIGVDPDGITTDASIVFETIGSERAALTTMEGLASTRPPHQRSFINSWQHLH